MIGKLPYGQKRQNVQNTQNVQNENMPKTCGMCGTESKTDVKMYAATSGDRWVIWRKIYKTEKRRFLCESCAKTYKPSLVTSLENRDKAELKLIPVYFPGTGNLLPATKRIQIELLPEFFPVTYLGDHEIVGEIVTYTFIADCIVVKFIPDYGQDYYMNYFTTVAPGFCYTIVPKWWQFPRFKEGERIKFISWFGQNGKHLFNITYPRLGTSLVNESKQYGKNTNI